MTIGELLAKAVDYLYGFWPVRIVRPWQQGVRLRGGKATASLGPGVHVFWPVIGDIIVGDTVIDVNSTAVQSCMTADDVSVSFALALKYRIMDLRQLYLSIQDHEATIANEVCAAAADHISLLEYAEVVGELTESVYNDVSERLEGWGIELLGVSLYSFCKSRTFRLLGDD